jgi:hypothetical protein
MLMSLLLLLLLLCLASCRDTPMLGADAAPAGSHVPLPLLLSRHHGLISSLEAAHAAYGPTVRLAKRWLGLQLLLGPTQVRVRYHLVQIVYL